MMQEVKRIVLPADVSQLSDLRAGDPVVLDGTIYTMRDAGHARALEYLDENGELPFGFAGQALFYAGPTPAAAGRPLGSVGPTTASRMDFASPALYEAGITLTLGKGSRSEEVREACKKFGTVHLTAVGGVAALLATHVISAETVAWEDLGAEALRKLELKDFPAFVAIDSLGNDIFEDVAGGR
ncbi:MAG: FumA C-terminus/TtdB family hydratase beta subunit [Coriobacteriales bacterium]|jgi:fumarate hydratase subunit beta